MHALRSLTFEQASHLLRAAHEVAAYLNDRHHSEHGEPPRVRVTPAEVVETIATGCSHYDSVRVDAPLFGPSSWTETKVGYFDYARRWIAAHEAARRELEVELPA